MEEGERRKWEEDKIGAGGRVAVLYYVLQGMESRSDLLESFLFYFSEFWMGGKNDDKWPGDGGGRRGVERGTRMSEASDETKGVRGEQERRVSSFFPSRANLPNRQPKNLGGGGGRPSTSKVKRKRCRP